MVCLISHLFRAQIVHFLGEKSISELGLFSELTLSNIKTKISICAAFQYLEVLSVNINVSPLPACAPTLAVPPATLTRPWRMQLVSMSTTVLPSGCGHTHTLAYHSQEQLPSPSKTLWRLLTQCKWSVYLYRPGQWTCGDNTVREGG